MEQSESRLIIDAKLYLCVLRSIISGQEYEIIEKQFRKLRSVIKSQPELTYCKVSNILSLLLLYTTPNSFSIKGIYQIAAIIQGLDQEEAIEVDLEELSNDLQKEYNLDIKNEIAIKSTADEILLNSKISGKKFMFVNEDDVLGEELHFLFVRSKTIQLSKYNNDIKVLYPLFSGLKNYSPFKHWFDGVVTPYVYYWDNFASFMELYTTFGDFERELSYEEKFEKLISPLEDTKGFNLSVEKWISNVIIPLIKQNDNNFTPLLKWLFTFASSKNNKYDIWMQCFRSIYFDSEIKYDSCKFLVKYYLGACYYFTIFYDNIDNLNSIEIMKIYSKIKDTLNIISKEVMINSKQQDIQIRTIEKYENFESFVNEKTNPLSSLFEPVSSCVDYLRDILETCEKLHPINKLTISDYLKFKYIEDSEAKKIEVSKILSNLDENNWYQLLTSSNIFIQTFTSKDISESINKLIIERFLIFNLFDVVIDLIDSKKIELNSNELYKMAEFKFWTSFNQASNLNENFGKLREASLCIKLFDKISLNNDLAEENREKIVEIKHLLKALSNMKNFKLIIEKNTPCTPKQVLNKIGSITTDDNGQLDTLSSPLNIIALILEQNPKSYIAFEKLYKILNDLLLFSNRQSINTDSPNTYFDKLKALCVESALVDNNFTFAYKKSKELFEHYANSNQSNLCSLWLTFYQVGKYKSPNWFEETSDASINKLEVLLKQREILTLTLSLPLDSLNDNSKILLTQWETIDLQIQEFFKNTMEMDQVEKNDDSSVKLETTTNLSNIISEATNSTNQASEKLSNLFVSGLGWAIGANQ